MRVLEAVEWNKLEAAKVLDISRGTLYRKIEEFGLEPDAARVGRRRRVRRAAQPAQLQKFVVQSRSPDGYLPIGTRTPSSEDDNLHVDVI